MIYNMKSIYKFNPNNLSNYSNVKPTSKKESRLELEKLLEVFLNNNGEITSCPDKYCEVIHHKKVSLSASRRSRFSGSHTIDILNYFT